jgi:hypothetical protein
VLTKATRGRVRIPKACAKVGKFLRILHEVLLECEASSHRFSRQRVFF